MRTIAVDMDGVLYDLLTPWLSEYNEIFNDDLSPEQVKTYELSQYTKCDRESLCYILEREDFWDSIVLYDGVYESIERLCKNKNIDLVIATATSYKTAVPKFQKLFQLLPMLNEKNLVITSRKELLDVDILIDDWENNLKKLAVSKNKMPILITQNYNKDFPNAEYGIIRCENLLEAVNLIL